MKKYRLLILFIIVPLFTNAVAQENSIALTLGNFDILQNSYNSPEVRIEYKFDKLKYNVIPFSGIMANLDGAFFVFLGLQYDIKLLDFLFLTPSFSPGFYEKGRSKNLNFLLEFRTQVELSIKLENNKRLGINFNHISNGRLSLYNPGVESFAVSYIWCFN